MRDQARSRRIALVRTWRLLSFLVLFSLGTGAAVAEDFQENIGFSPGHLFEMGQFGEAVDVTNGNLTLSVPIGPRYQLNDLEYGVTLTYNSKIWDYVNGESVFERQPFLKQMRQTQFGIGWTFHGGRVFLDDPNVPYYDDTQAELATGVPNPFYNVVPPPPKPRRIQYEAPDGSKTVLYAASTLDPLSDYFYSQDSTYLRARAYIVHEDNNPANDAMLLWKLWQPDGTTVIFGYQVGTGRRLTRHLDWVWAGSTGPQFNEQAFLVPPGQSQTAYAADLLPHDAEYGWYASRLESPRKFSSTGQCDGSNVADVGAPKVLELPGDQELVPCTYVEYFYDWDWGTPGTPAGQHSLPRRMPATEGVLSFMQDSLGRQIKFGADNTISFTSLGQPVIYTLEKELQDIEPQAYNTMTRGSDGLCFWTDPANPDNKGFSDGEFLQRISYPLGYTMEFEYKDPDCTGALSARVLPTGARSEYEYAVYPYDHDKTLGHSLVKRRLLIQGQDPAVWRYARAPWQFFVTGITNAPGEPEDPPTFINGGSGVPVWGPGASPVGPDVSDPGGGSGSSSSPTAEFSNPPTVYETDPDGNMTVYYLHTTCTSGTIGCVGVPNYLLGRTWKMLRVRGSSDSNFLSKEEYEYEYDGLFDYPYDVDPDTQFNPSYAANVRKAATKSVVFNHLGNTASRWTKQEDYLGFGKYAKTIEYQPESTVDVYRTTEKTYYFDEPNWILGLADSSLVREGLSGPLVSKSEVASRDAWGLPLVSRAYPAPAVGTEYIETTNVYNDKGALTRTDVANVGGPAAGLVRTTHFMPDGAGRLLYKRFGNLTWKAFERQYDFDSGLVTKTFTPAGVETSYSYDTLGRLTTITPGEGGYEYPTTITYPSLAQTEVRQGGSANFIESKYFYDQAGRLIRQEKRDYDDTYNGQVTRYDIAGRKVFESEWTTMFQPQPWPGTTFEYWIPVSGPMGPIEPGSPASSYLVDPQGRVTRVTSADGAVTETTYGMLTTTVKVKDLNRLPGSSTTPGSAPTESISVYSNDVFGRLVHVDAPDGEDASYSYDALDNLLEVNMGSQVRSFAYDGLGRLQNSNNPENGLVTFGAYDPTGLVVQKTDAAGVGTFIVYDEAGRPAIESRSATGQILKDFEYDTPNGGATDRATGRLVWIQTYEEDPSFVQGVSTNIPEVRRELFYEGLNGRLSKERVLIGDTTDALVTNYYHDPLGQLSQIDYPTPSWGGHSPTHVSYFYSNGLLSTVGDGSGSTKFIRSITYNPAGGKQKIEFGNDTESETLPDIRNRPEQIVVRVPDPTYAMNLPEEETWHLAQAAPWNRDWIFKRPLATEPDPHSPFPTPLPADLVAQIIPDPPGGGGGGGGSAPLIDTWDSGLYTYDGAGNIISIGPDVIFDGTTTTTAPAADAFTYDALSRLTGAVLHNLPGNPAGTMTMGYTFDGFGNMETRTRTVPGATDTWSFIHDGANHIQQLTVDETGPVETRTFTYDEVGNIASIHATSSEVNSLTNYVFDPQGRLKEVVRDSIILGRYGYDERGYRVRKIDDGIETLYVRDIEGRVLSEYRRPEGSGAPPVWDKDYVYALGSAVAVVKNEDPGLPTSFMTTWADNAGAMDVQLSWDKSTEDDIGGYVVYRDDLGESVNGFEPLLYAGNYSVVHDAGLSDPVTLADPGLVLGAYEYYVVTVDTAGHVSAESRHLVVDVNDPDYETVIWGAPPILSGDRKLTLQWDIDPARATRILGFNVYRDAGQGYVLLNPAALLETVGLIDTGLETGGAGLVNLTTYDYKVTTVNTRNAELPVATAEMQQGTPLDTTSPSPVSALEAIPGPYKGAITFKWAPSYAPDLSPTAPYAIYKDGTPISANPALLPGDDLFLLNFTSGTGDTIPGWTNVTPTTAWNGSYGWLDTNGLIGEDSDSSLAGSEQEDSFNLWAPGNGTSKTFQVQGVADSVYLVEIGVGNATSSASYTVTVNGLPYWSDWGLTGADWRHMERAIQADSSGHLSIVVGDGVYLNFVQVRETTPDPSQVKAIVDGLPLGDSSVYVVKAVDDDDNASDNNPSVTAAAWTLGTGYDIWVVDGLPPTAGEDFVHKIWEWGDMRVPGVLEPGTLSPIALNYDNREHGQPVWFRAAGFQIDFKELPPSGCPGVVLYRQGSSSLEWKRLNSQPLYGDPNEPEQPCDLVFFDTEVSGLEHSYWISQVTSGGESAPRPIVYEYAYAGDPSIVMGQYAYGANLFNDGNPNPTWGAIYIDPAGGWELGNMEPLSPVYLKWQPSYHQNVAGYRVWVKDAFRSPTGWKVLSTISDPTVVEYTDPDAPFNWPVVMDPNNVAPLQSRCRIHGNEATPDMNYNTPCALPQNSYFAFYHVEAFMDPNSTPVSPPDPASMQPTWVKAVRAVRLGSGECPDALTFCDGCEPEGCRAGAPWCPSTGCQGTDCCTWPDTWRGKELFRVNFGPEATASFATYPGYENVTEFTLHPATGGTEENSLLGWQSTTGLFGQCWDPLDPTCATEPEPSDVRPNTAVCYANANPDTRTFKMYTGPGEFYVELIGGQEDYCQRNTISVNGESYWADEVICGDILEQLITADAQGYINVTIGGPETQATSASCVAAVRIWAIGSTPDPIAFLTPFTPLDDQGYLLAQATQPADSGSVAPDEAPVATAALPLLGRLEIASSSGISQTALARDVSATQAAPDRIVGQVATGSTIEWLHADHLGSTRVVTNDLGEAVSRHKYLPFGQEFTNAGPHQLNTHKFTGHERDARTGLDYMMARYYAPEDTFRFLSVDPIQKASHIRKPSRWNRYRYANNNPLISIDPDGLEEITVTITSRIPTTTVGPSLTTLGTTFMGDGNSDTFRTRQTITIETDPAKSETAIVSQDAAVGMTTRISPCCKTSDPNRQPEATTASATRGADGSTTVNASGNEKDPLIPGAPGASYDLSLTINGEEFALSGSHDGYPEYTVEVTREDGSSAEIYNHNPLDTGEGPGSLFPPQEHEVDVSGTLPRNEED